MIDPAAGDRANRIARHAWPLVTLTSLALGLTLLWNATLAARFGASGELDAFWVGYALPKAVADSLHLGLLVLLFIVIFNLESADEHERWRLSSSVLNTVVLGTLVTILLVEMTAPLLVRAMGPGLSPQQLPSAVRGLRILSVTLLFTVITGAVGGLLNVHERFLPFALARVAGLALQVIVVSVLARSLGIDAAISALIAGSLGMLVVCLAVVGRIGLRYQPVIAFRSDQALAVAKIALALVATAVYAFLNQASDRYFASLMEAGSISALEFAWRFEIPVSQIASVSVALPAFAMFAVQAASGRIVDFRETLSIATRMVAMLVLPTVGFMTILRAPLASLWFERGAFSAQSSALVASLLPFLAVVYLCRAFSVILVFGLLSLHRTRILLVVMTVEFLANTALNFVLGRVMGVRGVVFATAIAIACASVVLWSSLLSRIGGVSASALARGARKIVVANAVALTGLALFHQFVEGGFLDGLPRLDLLIRVGALFAGFITVYVSACYVLGLVEIRTRRGIPRPRLVPSEWAAPSAEPGRSLPEPP